MGMFDTIILMAKCPYCGTEHEIDFQTKDLECLLEVYRVGDCIDPKKYWADVERIDNGLQTLADCRSKECLEWSTKSAGYSSGFGRMFRANVFLENNVVTGHFEVTELIDQDGNK